MKCKICGNDFIPKRKSQTLCGNRKCWNEYFKGINRHYHNELVKRLNKERNSKHNWKAFC